MRIDADDIADLQPVITAAVRAVLAEIEAADAKLDGQRLGYPEAEAAALLGLPRHVLRDCRLRGEIAARKIGARYVYSRGTLLAMIEAGK